MNIKAATFIYYSHIEMNSYRYLDLTLHSVLSVPIYFELKMSLKIFFEFLRLRKDRDFFYSYMNLQI